MLHSVCRDSFGLGYPILTSLAGKSLIPLACMVEDPAPLVLQVINAGNYPPPYIGAHFYSDEKKNAIVACTSFDGFSFTPPSVAVPDELLTDQLKQHLQQAARQDRRGMPMRMRCLWFLSLGGSLPEKDVIMGALCRLGYDQEISALRAFITGVKENCFTVVQPYYRGDDRNMMRVTNFPALN